MKINYLETELSPIGFLARDSLSGVAELVKGLITRNRVTEEKLSYWQLVFLQSKANGCSYYGEDLPHINWQWPENTWFQEQLNHHLGDAALVAGRPHTLNMSAHEHGLASGTALATSEIFSSWFTEPGSTGLDRLGRVRISPRSRR